MKRSISIVAGIVLAHATLALGAAQAFELVPGVVVDASSDTVFLMHPDGGIDSVATGSGALHWHSDSAAKPLGLAGPALVAQADTAADGGVLVVSLLDRVTGAATRKPMRIGLPDGVRATVDDQLGSSFLARAAVREQGLLLHWEHIQKYIKAIAPPPGMPLQHKSVAAYRLDPQAHTATAIDPAAFAADLPAPPSSVRTWVRSTTGVGEWVRAGGVLAVTHAVTDGAGRPQLVLKRWNAQDGTSLADVVLFTGPRVVQFYSADRRHLLVSARAAPGDFEEYEWRVFALATGTELGRLRHHQSFARFFVAHGALIYLERPYGRRRQGTFVELPRVLRSTLLEGGAAVWERPIRDPAYRGPYRP